MEFSAKQIAELLQGRVEGNENATVSTFAKIEEGKEGALSFLANPKYLHYIYETKSSIVLVDEGFEFDKPVTTTLIRVKSAYESISKLLQIYESMTKGKTGIDSLAFISPTAKIGENCYIGAFAYVGDNAVVGDGCQVYPHAFIGENVTIGNGCILYPNTTIYHECKIGNRCILHAGSVVGSDGFGFAPTPDGYSKIPQIGIVTLEDDVEIGANTCVDRSTMGSTYVRKGVKLDNLVQIAHNTDIGANTVMSSQVGIAGSTKIGEWCMFGGQVGVAGHITVGDHVNLGAQSGVPSSVEGNQNLMGTPPVAFMKYFRNHAMVLRLPDMQKQLTALQKQVAELQAKLDNNN